MALTDRLAAWWSSWQLVIYLALALAASLAGNVWQWKRAITAPLRAEVRGLEQAQATAAQLIADGQARERKLLDAADVVAGTMAQAGRDYREAKRTAPLPPQCAPGQARMDAVNRALGAKEPK